MLTIQQTKTFKRMQDAHDCLEWVMPESKAMAGDGEFTIDLPNGFYTLADILAIARDFQTLNKHLEH